MCRVSRGPEGTHLEHRSKHNQFSAIVGGAQITEPVVTFDRETFGNATEDELTDLSIPDRVLGVFVVSEDRAFKPQETASQIGAGQGAVSTALPRLNHRNVVEHRTTYCAVAGDANRLEGYGGYERATARYQHSHR